LCSGTPLNEARICKAKRSANFFDCARNVVTGSQLFTKSRLLIFRVVTNEWNRSPDRSLGPQIKLIYRGLMALSDGDLGLLSHVAEMEINYQQAALSDWRLR
jgi:hypothetical protein